MTNEGQLKVVVGYAGAGKTTCLETAKKVWSSSGYRVVGAAPTGRAAENLEGSGIASKTLHKWEQEWKEGREQLDRQSILVVDEAGMVDARRLHSLLKESEKTGFKVVLVGDPEQLSPIEAGCGLRTVMDKAGYCSISTVVRQYKDWQREATLKLATQGTVQALEVYDQKEHVHLTENPKDKLIQEFFTHLEDKDWDEKIGCLILAHTNRDVRELNTLARDEAREAGRLQGDDHPITITKCRESEVLGEEKDLPLKVTQETRSFAVGDQIVFLKNDYDLKVKNGQRGQITGIERDTLKIEAELGHNTTKSVTVPLDRYGFIDHGYAMTIHKSQGVTEEAVLVYGTQGMDRSLTYVSMTRHRSTADLYADSKEFEGKDRLFKALSRDNIKENVLDYALVQKDLILKEEADRRQKRKKLEETTSQKMGAFMSKILDKGRTWFGGNEGEERGQGAEDIIQVPSYQEEGRNQKTRPLSAQGSSDRGSLIQEPVSRESLAQEALKQNQRVTKTLQPLGQVQKDLPKVDMAAMEASLKVLRSSPEGTLSEAMVSGLGARERQGGEEAFGKGKEGLNKDQIKKGIPVYELEPDPYDDWSLSPVQKSPEVSGSRVSGTLSEEDRYRVTGSVAGRNPKTGETAAMEKKRREERGYTPLTEEQKYLVTAGIAGRNPKTGETAASERKRLEERGKVPLTEEQKYLVTGGIAGRNPKTGETAVSERKRHEERGKVPLTEEQKYLVTSGIAGRNPKTGETAASEKKRQEERGKVSLTEEQKYAVTGGIAGRNPKTGETAAAERKRSEELKALPLAERQKLIKANSVVVSKTPSLSVSLPKQGTTLENKKGGRPRKR